MARVQYIQMSKFRANIFWYNLLWATCGPQQFANFWISKSIFYVKNYLNLSNFFSTLKNIIFRSTLLLFLFFENFNFWSTLFLEINLRSFSWSATHNLGHPSRDVRLQKLEGSKILVSLIKGVARLAENRYNWKSITFFKGRTKFLRFELCTMYILQIQIAVQLYYRKRIVWGLPWVKKITNYVSWKVQKCTVVIV